MSILSPALKPVPVDSNGRRLVDRGSDLGCDIRSLDTNWLAIQFPVDLKGLTVGVISGTVYLDGTMDVSKAWFDAAAAVDSGGGTVTIAAANHGFAHDGTATVTIYGTTNYDGSEVLLAASDANNLVITATYVAENILATAYAIGRRYPYLTVGQSIDFPIAKNADTTYCSLKASTTAVVALFGWR